MLDPRRVPDQGAGAKGLMTRRQGIMRQAAVARVQRQHEMGVFMRMKVNLFGRQGRDPQIDLVAMRPHAARLRAQEFAR
ncbi:hypothetical protein D3C87_1570560 [compost metagenome]